MCESDLATDRQAQSAAFDLASARAVHAVEAVEQVLAVLMRHTGAVVGDRDADLAFPLPGQDVDAAPRWRELDCVLDEVREGEVKSVRIRLCVPPPTLEHEGDALRRGQRPQGPGTIFDGLSETDPYREQFEPVLFDLGQGQQVVDGAAHSVDFVHSAVQHLPRRRGELVAAEADVDLGAHDRERSPELVRGIGDEPALVQHAPLDPVEHGVEGQSEVADLVGGGGDRDTLVQPVGPDLLGVGRHPFERTQRSVRQPVGPESGNGERRRSCDEQ